MSIFRVLLKRTKNNLAQSSAGFWGIYVLLNGCYSKCVLLKLKCVNTEWRQVAADRHELQSIPNFQSPCASLARHCYGFRSLVCLFWLHGMNCKTDWISPNFHTLSHHPLYLSLAYLCSRDTTHFQSLLHTWVTWFRTPKTISWRKKTKQKLTIMKL